MKYNRLDRVRCCSNGWSFQLTGAHQGCSGAAAALDGSCRSDATAGQRRDRGHLAASRCSAPGFTSRSPRTQHQYLTHRLTLIGTRIVALLIERVVAVDMARRSSWRRLVGVLLIVEATMPAFFPGSPIPDRSLNVLTQESNRGISFVALPDVGRSSRYAWSDCRDAVFYLREHVPPGDRIANALRGLSATINGPTAWLPAIPEVALSWFRSGQGPARAGRHAISARCNRRPGQSSSGRLGEEDAKESFLAEATHGLHQAGLPRSRPGSGLRSRSGARRPAKVAIRFGLRTVRPRRAGSYLPAFRGRYSLPYKRTVLDGVLRGVSRPSVIREGHAGPHAHESEPPGPGMLEGRLS